MNIDWIIHWGIQLCKHQCEKQHMEYITKWSIFIEAAELLGDDG